MATLVQSADAMETLYSHSNTGATPTSSSSSQHFNDGKFYLLVVIGEVTNEEHLKCAIADIEKGIRSWDTNLIDCNLDQELKLFVSRHSARFSADVRGQRILHHKSNVLETVVLINPSDEAVSTEVRLMISDTARHKLLVLSGQCSENTGELILQSGSFSFYNFIDIFTDQEIGELLSTIHPANKANLTLSCPDQGDWKNSNLDKHNLQDFINMKLNSVLILPEMEGLSEFTEYLFESVEIPAPFDLLEPPTSGGFLKLSKPCCYIFPGGRGDSALFAVNGFNMLINGGSDRKSCFWKLVRHLDRVDSILLTHIGDDNLPGINSMLQRKVAEFEEEQSQGSTANSDWTNNMISPDIGVVFVNVPENLDNTEPNSRVRRTIDEVAMTQQLLAKLNLRVESLQRPVGNIIEPVILFQKMGVGKLEMYVLNPSKNSKEMQHFMKHWKGSEKDTSSILLPNGKESEYPVSYLTSISSLIVWHPANVSDKVVRVLFPGNATQKHIFEGLEKLKHLDFLKQPVVTQKGAASSVPSTPTLKQAKMKHRADSRESLKSSAKPAVGKAVRKESKEEAPEKAKTDSESLPEKTQKVEKKDKPLVKKEKVKVESTAKSDAAEKKKEVKSKSEKVLKKEPKKSLENKKEAKKEAVKKDDTPKLEVKTAKKIVKKDTKKESLVSEDKKELKKDLKKVSKDAKKNVAEGKIVVSKPKAPKKDAGPASKLKDKSKSKLTKKESSTTSSKADDITATAAEDPEVERSLMSSPEDLTKDFEELRAELLTEDEATVQEPIVEEVIQREDVTQTKESPEAFESVDEGITSTEVDGDNGGSPDEQIIEEKVNVSTCEKFEDEGTVMEETLEGRDSEEKVDMEEAYEPEKGESVQKSTQDEHLGSNEGKVAKSESDDAQTSKTVELQHLEVSEVEEQQQVTPVPHKVSSPISPAASIHDEMIPFGFENSASDDENRNEQPEDFTVTSGLTQSTVEISSVPTALDDMATPKDAMSDETGNDESPTQDDVNLETSPSEEFDKQKLSPLQCVPEYNRSHSDATEGHDYNVSASTISPCSLLEDDKQIKEVEEKKQHFVSIQESSDQDDASPLPPFIRSPSVESKQHNLEMSSNFTAAIELSTTLAKSSPEDKTLEGTTSPQSSGHTPYYQSPVDEKVVPMLPVGEEETLQGPVIVEVISDKEDSSRVTPEPDEPQQSTEKVMCASQNTLSTGQISQSNENKDTTPVHVAQKKNEDNQQYALSSSTYRHETDNNNFATFKEESKMSISEGTTSDKSGTPLEEVVAEDTFSHLASASTASLATSSLPEPTTDSRSLHAEVGSPHSTEVDDSLSVSVVQTPTTFHEAEESPTKEDSPRPMSISPDISPKTKNQAQMDTRSPEHSTMSVEFGQESPDHSLALDFSKQSPEHPSQGSSSHATENGPTEVDYSPSGRKDIKSSEEYSPTKEKSVLFEECDARATSATPSEASQSTPSVTTPCHLTDLTQNVVEHTDKSPSAQQPVSVNLSNEPSPSATTPCQLTDLTQNVVEQTDRSPSVQQPLSVNLSNEPSPLLEDSSAKENISPVSSSVENIDKKTETEEKENHPTPPKVSSPSPVDCSKEEKLSPERECNQFMCTESSQDMKCPSSPKIPSPSSFPHPFDQSNVPCGSKDPASDKPGPCGSSKTDVDLCLVSSCEYRHPKTELSPSFINPTPLEYFISEEGALDEEKPLAKSGGGSRPPGGKLPSKQCEETPPTSLSDSAPSQTDSDVPPGTEECPSITADANIDSEDDSETLPTDRTLTYRHIDPPPIAQKDAAPSPGHHDVCMVDPEALKAEENANTDGSEKPQKKKLSKKSTSASKTASSKTKDTKSVPHKKSVGEGKDAKNATNTSASRGVKSATGSGKGSSATALPNCPPMYMDLVYIPNHCSAKTVNAEFFKLVRSSYYVISGNNQTAQEPNKVVLDALLEGKAHWEHNMQVTLIPTHDTDVLREWYQETHDKQQELNIMVLASSSTVVMQDESFPACKIEM